MKKILLLAQAAAFLVTYKVSGYSIQNCQDPKQADPLLGACVAPFEGTKTQSFPSSTEARKFLDALKQAKRPYVISEIHMYEEKK